MISKRRLFSMLRPLLRSMTAKCNKCNSRVIELLMDKLSGRKVKACFKCRSMTGFLSLIISLFPKYKSIALNRKDLLLNNYLRKYVVNALRGIGLFGLRQPIAYSSPLFATWNITKKCNLKCSHCYQEADAKSLNGMSTKQAFRIINKLVKANVIGILFGGGEPFIRKDFIKIIKHARGKGLLVNISTNATLINERIASKLKSLGVDRVTVSLDGLEKTHDLIRGVKGTFKKAVKGIKLLKKHGLNTAIASTVTRVNYKEIPKVLKLAKQLGVNNFLLNNFVPCGRGSEELDITPKEREKLLKLLYKELLKSINDEGGIDCSTGCSPFYSRIAIQTETKKKKIVPASMVTGINFFKRYGFSIEEYADQFYDLFNKYSPYIGACTMATSYIAINQLGDVWPCTLMPAVIGNLLKDDLGTIWRNNKILNDVRKRELYKEPCRSCHYTVCRGCRARAYAYFNDHLQYDPGCLLAQNLKKNFYPE